MQRAISISRGKGNLGHDNRDFVSANVDENRIQDNIVIKQQSLWDAYDEVFGKAVDEYNDKQKREDRKIYDYFEKLFGEHSEKSSNSIIENDNKQKSFYEYVVGVGSMYDTGLVDSILKDGTKIEANPEAAKIATECLKDYILGNPEIGVQSFEERNPNFYIFNAVIHLDEKTPHLHYDFIPFADGYIKGMTRQQGISKALEQMGYGKGEQAIYNFTQTERLVFQKICEAHGFEIKPQEKGRGFTVPARMMSTYYPKIQKYERIVKEQEQQIKSNNKELDNIKAEKDEFIFQTNELIRDKIVLGIENSDLKAENEKLERNIQAAWDKFDNDTAKERRQLDKQWETLRVGFDELDKEKSAHDEREANLQAREHAVEVRERFIAHSAQSSEETERKQRIAAIQSRAKPVSPERAERLQRAADIAGRRKYEHDNRINKAKSNNHRKTTTKDEYGER